MPKFVVALQAEDDRDWRATPRSPVGFSNGKSGFTCVADDHADATRKVIDRAKKDGFYGCGYRAMIVELDKNGHRKSEIWCGYRMPPKETYIDLWG